MVLISWKNLFIFSLLFTNSQILSAANQAPIFLDQGWDKNRRDQFYYTPQGSQLFPYQWFMALEQHDNNKLFATPENLKKFGWIASGNGPSELNPGSLPVGFAIDPVKQPGTGQWIGLTCAACHTNNVTHQDKTIRIEGGPAMADFGEFLAKLSYAVTMSHPLVDKDKFKNFAVRVLGENANEQTIAQLSQAYIAVAIPFNSRAWMRTPPLHAGPGRVDALNQIINSLTVFNLSQPSNLYAPIAPVSYPFLWLTPKLEWVQWNPIASDPIARNVGEVLGVFGHADFNPLINNEPNSKLYSSTALLKELYALEQWVDELKPPRWPEDILGNIDQDLWKKGEALFKKDCLSCHNMPTGPNKAFRMTKAKDNEYSKQFIEISAINYKDVNTDSIYVDSLNSRLAKPSQLSVFFDNKPVVPAAEFFTTTVGSVVRKSFAENQLSEKEMVVFSGYRFRPVGYKWCDKVTLTEVTPYSPCSTKTLKAGPLLGIWATGPYLHNGSVPTIFQLLSPPEDRDKEFWVGNLELDTENLGFKSNKGIFKMNTKLLGNGNRGHIYPNQPYNDEQRLQVIEYLKDPERFL